MHFPAPDSEPERALSRRAGEYTMSSTPRIYHWLCLTGAIVAEVGGTVLMKASQSWAYPYAAESGIAMMLCLIAVSYYLLALATTALPVGVAFACWEGLGLSLITLSSVFVLGEHMSLTRFLALGCVVGGVMLIHRGTAHGPENTAAPAEGAGAGEPEAGLGALAGGK